MADLGWTDASVSVLGDDLDPDEISALMGCAPSRAERKGQVLFVGGPGKPSRMAHRGLWRLQAAERQPGDLEAQIWELLAMLPQDLTLWHGLAARFQVAMFCGVFMKSWNDGVRLPAVVLGAMAERRIVLDLDIYVPASDGVGEDDVLAGKAALE